MRDRLQFQPTRIRRAPGLSDSDTPLAASSTSTPTGQVSTSASRSAPARYSLRWARALASAERTPPPAIGGEGAGWEWMNRVRSGIRDGSVAVNAAGAWLHNIEGEAYAVSPACFEAFAAGRGLAPATVRNRVVRLGRHRQRASPSGAANLFRAVLADGSRVKGMVFPGELMWDDERRAGRQGPVTGS